MKTVTFDEVASVCDKKGYWFPKTKQPYDIFMFGIRNPDKNQSKDSFNDTIGCCFRDTKSNPYIFIAEATTDPSVTELRNPTFIAAQKDGTAILKEGQYRTAYKLGVHGTGSWRHTALLQVKPVTIYRDKNRNDILDLEPSKTTTGFYGINIHAASLWTNLDKIGGYSAGCQVIRKPEDYNTVIYFWQKQVALGLGDLFTYTLFTEEDFK